MYHLRFKHEIEDVDQFLEAIQHVGAEAENRRLFAQYVMGLQEKKSQGLITAEDYRKLMMEWAKEHR